LSERAYRLVQEDRGHEIVENLSDLRVPLDVLLVALNELVLSLKRLKLTFLIVR